MLTRARKRLLAAAADPILGLGRGLDRFGAGRSFDDRRLPPDGPEPQAILVIRLDAIGDALLSEPAIAALRQRFPTAIIDVVVSSGGRAVLAGNPAVSSFIVFDAPWHGAWRDQTVAWRRDLARAAGLLSELRQRRYDIAIELRGDVRDIAFAAAAGPRVIVGSSRRGGAFLLDHNVHVPEGANWLESALCIVAALGASPTARAPLVYIPEEAEQRAAALLGPPEAGDWVALHLGAGFRSKCLPPTTFATVAAALAERGLRPLLVGGADDAPLAEVFTIVYRGEALNLIGELSVLETAAALKQCRLFVGSDSAPMHLAAAVGTPVVAGFGPSSPREYHPWGAPYHIVSLNLPCSPCDLVHCQSGDFRCMRDITAESIVAAASFLMEGLAAAVDS